MLGDRAEVATHFVQHRNNGKAAFAEELHHFVDVLAPAHERDLHLLHHAAHRGARIVPINKVLVLHQTDQPPLIDHGKVTDFEFLEPIERTAHIILRTQRWNGGCYEVDGVHDRRTASLVVNVLLSPVECGAK